MKVSNETPTSSNPNSLTIQLERPLCFLDVETTGTDVEKDRIIELSLLKIEQTGNEALKTVRINPGIPIPKEATDIHGITDADVKDLPKFEAYAKGILLFIEGCDMVGFNSNRFDVPFLFYSLQRAGIHWDWRSVNLVDVCGIFKIKEERTLSAAVHFYCDHVHLDSHNAESDLKATRDVFLSQLAVYPDLPKNLKDLALFSNWGKEIVDMAGKFAKDKDGDIVFTFGQHKDKKAKTQIHYLEWMIAKGDFPEDTKEVARKIFNKTNFHYGTKRN